MLLSSILFSGCIDENISMNNDNNELNINYFNIIPNMITQGETANISWNITGASTVDINMGIGAVDLQETRIISPHQNTTYILTASNLTHSINASVNIIVKSVNIDNDSSFNNPPEDLKVTGPDYGFINTMYVFDVKAFDPDENDSIIYYVYWGDGSMVSSDYLMSGVSVEFSHKWLDEGIYAIDVFAEDESNEKSDTVGHIISIAENTNDDDVYDNSYLSLSILIFDSSSKITIDSVSDDNILWDDVEILLINITDNNNKTINYEPLISIVDKYVSAKDIIILRDISKNDEYELILTYIPDDVVMGSISWTQ